MKIVTVIGARPQFIKAAMGSRQLRKSYDEVLVHTGQHFDKNMSDVFFNEMQIPKPDYSLGVSGGSHTDMTARMMISLEKVFLKEKPDAVLVYGDTNSTLSGALVAAKLHIPIFHIESGNRLGTLNNPEEINRVLTDHLSRLKFCATMTAIDSLTNEGIGDNSYFVGNIMLDAYMFYSRSTPNFNSYIGFDNNIIKLPKEYFYMTCHREENTSDANKLYEILKAMSSFDIQTIYSVHPRNRIIAEKICKDNKFSNIILINPVGYVESLYLINNALKIITDSGGLQCEAFLQKNNV